MENKRRRTKDELIQAYKEYLQKTREEAVIRNANKPSYNSVKDSQEIIKNNFGRLRDEFQHAIKALEQQYVCHYEQLIELRTSVDYEKNAILQSELTKWRAAFEDEIKDKKESWLKEEAACEERKKERENIEKVYTLNFELWKKELDSFEKRKSELERELEKRTADIEQEVTQRRNELERNFQTQKDRIEQQKYDWELQRQQWQTKTDETRTVLETERAKLIEQAKQLEKREDVIEKQERECREMQKLIEQRRKEWESEELVLQQKLELQQKNWEQKMKLERSEMMLEFDQRSRRIEADYAIKQKELLTKEKELADIQLELNTLRVRIEKHPEEIEKIIDDTKESVIKDTEKRYRQRLEQLKLEHESEIKLYQQMNTLLESKLQEREQKIQSILAKMGQQQFSDQIVAKAVERITKAGSIKPQTAYTDYTVFPKIVRPIRNRHI